MADDRTEPGQDTNLGAYSPVDYMSITSFPRLPEDDAGSTENVLRFRKEDDCSLGDPDPADPDLFLKSARLRRLPSSSSEMGSQEMSPLRVTSKDPFSGDCTCRQDGLTVIITACLTFATGVTVALVMQIYFGDPQIFHQGTVVTDVARCSALGTEILNRDGSSVDAAIVSALCSGIIHPHSSGIGGGGVMLVHDIRKNESFILDFRETAPAEVEEQMFSHNGEDKPGLLVAIPGMLKGLYQAHQLYGRISWSKLMAAAADVAKEGFNITQELAKAINQVKDKNLSDNFRETFLPYGQPLQPGAFMKRSDLAAVLNAVGVEGTSAFYNTNVTEEMVSEVRSKGGVMSEEDFANYTVIVEKPVEGSYQGHLVLTAPPPHVGPALISALNIMEGFNITTQAARNLTFHLLAESLKIALAQASTLSDPFFDSSVAHTSEQMLSKSEANVLRQLINDSVANPPGHYMQFNSLEAGHPVSQVHVIGPDDLIVSVVSSLNRPFGSGIMTTSGILLNSQMLDFSWNKTQDSSTMNLRNNIQPGKRPMSFLLPTIARPLRGMCGTYLSLGASSGIKSLSSITEVLLNIFSFRKNLNESLTLGRLAPQLHPNNLQVDNEFLEEDVEFLEDRGHVVVREEILSSVHIAKRVNDIITGAKDPRSSDAAASVIS
ncbi:glutathione hydrolase 7 [Callorhinchus milii]|nr:glutathione hydrolase 7 [Callorhinchus milii]XP_007903404.1 glutathione hydrolase 7 [Callorhinchus milii]|eukprot:gi/632973953/ref/XP_007903403.1/ PREDICTED: gamma-glutamyltransferase 7 [Callorhinchus milii]